jgi:hypothetical protein
MNVRAAIPAIDLAQLDLSPTPWRLLLLSERLHIWTLIDAEDWPWVIECRWNYGWHNKTPWKYYAKRNVGPARSTVYLHREILTRVEASGAGDGMHGDHINGQSLDNRRCNLRWATPTDNRRNAKPRGAIPSLETILTELLAATPTPAGGDPPF